MLQNEEYSRSEQRLDNVLEAWGMVRHKIDGDGNCCFSAVAFSLVATSSLIIENNPIYLEEIGLDATESLHLLSLKLRKLTVKEWTNNPQDYEGFVPGVDVTEEAIKFLQNGYFFGELADTIVLALSNLLGIPFIIFSSSITHPVITITPRKLIVPIPLYLAYNRYGAGHYDGTLVHDNDDRKNTCYSIQLEQWWKRVHMWKK